MKLQYYTVVDVVTHISKKERSGGNEEQIKLNKLRIKRVYVRYKLVKSFAQWTVFLKDS